MAFDPRAHIPIRTLSKTIDASCYNRIALALARLGDPLEAELPALRMTIRVERRLWLGRSLINDVPLMAWLNFQVAGRGLHEPVLCQLHLYHFHAGLLVGQAPLSLAACLQERLTQRQGTHEGRPVAPFVRR